MQEEYVIDQLHGQRLTNTRAETADDASHHEPFVGFSLGCSDETGNELNQESQNAVTKHGFEEGAGLRSP